VTSAGEKVVKRKGSGICMRSGIVGAEAVCGEDEACEYACFDCFC